MAWEVEYGMSQQNFRWYWRLIDRQYDPPWIAAEGGGGYGHETQAECWGEIQEAKRVLFAAQARLVQPYS